MPKFIEGKIECPFYIDEGKRYISCEGVIKGTTCVHSFESEFKKAQHEEGVCSVFGGRKCQHYRMLSVLYERGLLS